MNRPKTLLILSANPRDTARLRLDVEVREIDEGLRRARHRDQFNIRSKWAVRLRDLRRAILDHKPQIVHFCGHGEEQGIIGENEEGKAVFANPEALAGLFALFTDHVECVVLNACYSQSQAKAINRHIPYVIGMKEKIKDKAAIEFAVGFYDALGAGKSVEKAFEFGRNAIQFCYLTESQMPILNKNPDILQGPKNDLIKANLEKHAPGTGAGKPNGLTGESALSARGKIFDFFKTKRMLSILLALLIIFIAIGAFTGTLSKINNFINTMFPKPTPVESREQKIIIKAVNIKKEDTLKISEELMKVVEKFKESDIKWEISLQTRAPKIEGKILLLYPYQAVRKKNIPFIWSPPDGVEKYRLLIYDNKNRKILEKDKSTRFFLLDNSANLLIPGQTYFWEVKSIPPGIAVSRTSYFHILSQDQKNELIAHLKNVSLLKKEKTLSISPQLLQASVLIHYQLFGEAKEILGKYVTDNPENSDARHMLLYVFNKLDWYWKLKNKN